MIVSDSFVIADWTDPGTRPGRPIAGLHLHRSDYAQIFEEHDSELLE
jgi:hypothetical protein